MKRQKEDADERWRRVWRGERPLPELPSIWRRSLHDTLREFGGNCTDNCGHFDHNGKPRDQLDRASQ